MSTPASITGDLTLGHIFNTAGLDLSQVVVLRHTYTSDGLATPADVTPAKVLEYVRRQGIGNKLGKTPPLLWLNFMTDGGRRSRFLTAYENHGEVTEGRTADLRYFDLRPSDVLASLKGRLVVEWSRDAVNWAKTGAAASAFPLVEIADPVEVPFPGFDKLLIGYGELVTMVEDRRYAEWHSALGAVQGIYLIADTTNGQLYVGKADGGERILGRWAAYARDGHGGNVALRQLAGLDSTHARHFKFSILQVFGPAATSREIDEAESHYKEALLTRRYGMNRN
ncbi:GIY-YIG nuclease family protein [Cellulomonas sp.]|uniref:GIY-YIG nuclease family protein n=1 Tax=Cellulomonas sp. TaxID=40001 RepID=UPI003BA9667F